MSQGKGRCFGSIFIAMRDLTLTDTPDNDVDFMNTLRIS